jgi:O-antigen/teichoic acid export membrane protein
LTEYQKSYRQIFKATSLFGGVEAFNIIISIVRSKFVAILLGPAGMGIVGLLTSTTSFVSSLTNLGLGTSAIKNVSAAASTSDDTRISKVVTVLRRLVWLTGLLGMVLTALLSPWLSELTFGNRDYTVTFIWISVTLLFKQLSSGQIVVLQGLRKLNYLARANVLGSVIGLLITVPIYFIWRLDGIVPVIIISSLTSMLLSWYFAKKSEVRSIQVSREDTFVEGREMIKMGFMISLSGLIFTAASYIVRIYINNNGGVEQVGLYTAGIAIVSTYIGMVFTAMGTDYYPRLSGVAHDNRQATLLINQQAEVAILILAPIMSIFLIFINWVVILLFSTKFTLINGMIHWAALGMYFKAASWSIAYLFLARGASKLFFLNELAANIYLLGLNILGYMLFGLDGLGISFLIGYIIYFMQVFSVAWLNYDFRFNREFRTIFAIQLILGILCFTIMRFISTPWSYILGVLAIMLSSGVSIIELNKRMDLKNIFLTYLKR